MSDLPRETNRESTRPPRESAKQRAVRIPLPYYKGLTRLDALKWLLTAAAVMLAGGYVAWTLGGWSTGNELAVRQLSPGPVAGVHAAWNGKCAACHVTGVSLRQDGQAVSLVSATLTGRAPFDHTASDQQCQNCHAGPAHHANQKGSEVWSCSGCHRDHQGQGADLTRVADVACTRCHTDIAAHREGNSILGGADAIITAFHTDHPKFRSLTEQKPGHLRFNHRLHMLPGQAPKDALDSAKKKLGDIDAQYADRLKAPELASIDSQGVIQLQCAYCHEPDSAVPRDSAQAASAVPTGGEYMQPINFERHCAACHNGELIADVSSGGKTVVAQLPHGQNAEAIRLLLTGLVHPAQGSRLLSPEAPLQPIPGKTSGENLAQTMELAAAARIAAAEVQLRGADRCGKCHDFDPQGDADSVAVWKPEVPAVWLRYARFDHSAHRTMKCFACHDQKLLQMADEENGKPPLDEKPPILPDIENCRECHAPTAKAGGTGARHDCAECHRYHAGDFAPHSRGTIDRGVPAGKRLDSPSWISGGR